MMINYFAIETVAHAELLRRGNGSIIFVFEDSRGLHETKDSHAMSLSSLSVLSLRITATPAIYTCRGVED